MDLDTYQIQIELGLNDTVAKAKLQQLGGSLDDVAKRLEKSLGKSTRQIESYTSGAYDNIKRSTSNAKSLDQAFMDASKSIGNAGKRAGTLNDLEAEVAAGLGKQSKTMRDIGQSQDEIVSQAEQEAKNRIKAGESLESQVKPIRDAMIANGEIRDIAVEYEGTLKKQNIFISMFNDTLTKTKELWTEAKRDMAQILEYYTYMTKANDKFFTSNNRVYGTQVDMIRATRDLSIETSMLRDEAIAAYEALVEVRTPVEDMKQLATAIGQVERITGISTKSLAGWTRQLRAAGFNTDKQTKSLEFLAAAQRALSIDTKNLEQAMSGAGLTASELATFFGKDAPQDFLIARLALEGIATAAGINEKALAELYGVLEKTGAEAAVFWQRFNIGADASVEDKFNALMMNADKALEGLGLTLEQIAEKGNTIEKGILDKVSKSLGISLDTLRQLAQAKKDLKDSGQLDLMDFGLTREKIEAEQKKMKSIVDMFGEANSTLPRQMAIFQDTWKNQGRSLEQLFQIVGIKVFKALTALVKYIDPSPMIDTVVQNVGAVYKHVVEVFEAAGIQAAISAAFQDISGLLSNGLKTFTNFFKNLQANWKNSKINAIFQTFATEAGKLWVVIEPELRNFYNQFVNWIGTIWNGVDGQKGVKDWLFNMWGNFKSLFIEYVYPHILTAVNWFTDFFQDVMAGNTSNITHGPIYNALLKAVNWVADSLVNLLGNALNSIWNFIVTKISNSVNMHFDLMLSGLKEKMLIALEYAKAVINPFSDMGSTDSAIKKLREERRDRDLAITEQYKGDTSGFGDAQARRDQSQFNDDANKMSSLARQIERLEAQNAAGEEINKLLKQREVVRLEMELHEAQRRNRGAVGLIEYEKEMTRKIEKAKADAVNSKVKVEDMRVPQDDVVMGGNDPEQLINPLLAFQEQLAQSNKESNKQLTNALLTNNEQLTESLDQTRAIETRLQGSFDPLVENLRGIEGILGGELSKTNELLANPPTRTQTIATVQVMDKKEGVSEDDSQYRISEAQLAAQHDQLKILNSIATDTTTRQAIMTIANLVQAHLPGIGHSEENGFDSTLTKWG